MHGLSGFLFRELVEEAEKALAEIETGQMSGAAHERVKSYEDGIKTALRNQAMLARAMERVQEELGKMEQAARERSGS